VEEEMNNIEIILKEIYKYVYSTIDRVLGYLFLKRKFYKRHGYHLNLHNPQTFSEKVVWKKVNDRNPLLPVTADKYKVRKYLTEKLGDKDAKEILIPLLYVTDDPKTIPFDKLPSRYIIKSNFGSGQNLIVNEKSAYSKKEIIDTCQKWLKKSYGVMYHEWAYQQIERKIVIEELLLDETGNIPKDFKFYIFRGKCKMVLVICDRFSELTRTLYSREWEKVPAKYKSKKDAIINKPHNYKAMLQLAEKLGKEFDFVRVDFYSVGNKVYFGEMTHYPGSGMGIFTPRSYDLELGKNWEIIPRYWT
jgi:hypothetical protein